MTTPTEDTQSDRKVTSRWIIYGLLAEALVIVGCCLPVAFFLGGGEVLARSMLPPVYPGAKGSCSAGAASAIVWTDCVYTTEEGIDPVLAYYEGEMPGFSLVQFAGQDGTCYNNGRSDTGPLGQLAAQVTDGQTFPGVSVTICDEGAQSGSTLIQLSASWPAQ